MTASTSFGSNIIMSKPLLVISNVAKFHMSFNFIITVLFVVLSSILTIASSDISSINGPSTFINFYSFGFYTMCSLGKIFRDLFKKLKQQFCKFIMPSNSKMLLIPRIKSTFLWISDTKVYISNLCPYISIIIGIINKTLTNCPFPTWILCVLDANLGREWSDLQHK